MKRGCMNGLHNIRDNVYFVVIIDDKPCAVKYKILEKIECEIGIGYLIDVAEEQDEPEIKEFVTQQRVGNHFRICGDSLFKTREDALKKAREYFQGLAEQLSAYV